MPIVRSGHLAVPGAARLGEWVASTVRFQPVTSTAEIDISSDLRRGRTYIRINQFILTLPFTMRPTYSLDRVR